MQLQNLPDFDDKFIGEAILSIMVFFMFVWVTSGASPIHFGQQAKIAVLVAHLEVILVAVVPIALLGLVQSLRGGTATRSSVVAQRLSARVTYYRKSHSPKHRYKKPTAESESIKDRESVQG